jgi:hypothetical protein
MVLTMSTQQILVRCTGLARGCGTPGKEGNYSSSVAFLLAYHRGTSEEMRQPLDGKGKQLAVADSVSGATSEAMARWIPPPVGWIKLNTEGSLRKNCNTGDALCDRQK